MTFWLLYDYAGSLILLNLLTLSVVIGPGWVIFKWSGDYLWLPAALMAALGVLAVAGQATLFAALINEEEFSLRRALAGVVECGPRALGLASLFSVVGVVVGTAVWFYQSRVVPAHPAAGLLFGGFCLSAGVAVMMPGVYVIPALANQRASLRSVLRTSVLLAVGHPVLTTGLLVELAGLGLLLATPPGLLLFSSLPLVALASSAYALLARHHGAIERGPILDEHDIYLNRGFKDFLFPWQG